MCQSLDYHSEFILKISFFFWWGQINGYEIYEKTVVRDNGIGYP